jgi:hypothetical protein
MTKRPTCANCKKPLAKKVESHSFWVDADDAPRSKAECQRRTNHSVVSVRYWPNGKVRRFSAWDGVSFKEGPFCSDLCGRQFGLWAWTLGARRA